jgi:hypothetical protein
VAHPTRTCVEEILAKHQTFQDSSVVRFPLLDITARRKKSGDSLVANPSTTTRQPLTHKLTSKNENLTDNQFEQVKNLFLSGLKPSDILQVMKKTQSSNKPLLATKSTIYVAKQKVKEQSLQDLSPIFHLNKQLTFSNYTTCSKVDSGGNLKALFFIHSLSLGLLSFYHTVLFLDCTYKTNKYNMPLLHIAGFSGNNKTFSSAAFCFLAEENLEYYSWALETFSSTLTSHEIPPPDFLLTDCELALMNAIAKFFLNSIHMLCTWHINKNILANASKIVKNADEEKQIMSKWSQLTQISNTADFYSSFKIFSSRFNSQFVEYVEKTWLPLAPRFVDAWTKKSLTLITVQPLELNLLIPTSRNISSTLAQISLKW